MLTTPSRIAAHDPEQPREAAHRNPIGRYTPTRVNEHTRWRFFRHRSAELIRRVGGEPNERARLAIEMLAKSEWTLFVAEHDAAASSGRARADVLRVANDARRQVLLWTRELTAATPPPAAAAPPDPMAALHEHLARSAARRSAEPQDEPGDEEAA